MGESKRRKAQDPNYGIASVVPSCLTITNSDVDNAGSMLNDFALAGDVLSPIAGMGSCPSEEYRQIQIDKATDAITYSEIIENGGKVYADPDDKHLTAVMCIASRFDLTHDILNNKRKLKVWINEVIITFRENLIEHILANISPEESDKSIIDYFNMSITATNSNPRMKGNPLIKKIESYTRLYYESKA